MKEYIQEIRKKISSQILDNIDFKNELEFCDWFENNFSLFGFTRIIQRRYNRFPDFRMEYKGIAIEVEIETLSSHFIQHNHDSREVDLVICIRKDKDLDVEIISMWGLGFKYNVDLRNIKIYADDLMSFNKSCILEDTTQAELFNKVWRAYKNGK